MDVKNRVLDALLSSEGISLSGEAMAGALGVSRAAIWKAVKTLQKEGYLIDAVTNKGYLLKGNNDILSKESICRYIKDRSACGEIFVYKSLDSTNIEAKRLLDKGVANGTIVIADEQMQGRGRKNRSFYSPKNSGIYMSIILRPENLSVIRSLSVTCISACLICQAIEELFGLKTEIKWINDIILNGKKICGILTEGSSGLESGTLDYIIIGIGINFWETPLPQELKGIAGALFDKNKELFDRNRLIARIIELFSNIEELVKKGGFIEEYKNRSYIIGKKVQADDGEHLYKGRINSFTDKGYAVMELEEGGEVLLNSGEVSLIMK